jgi:hypothetical protein
MMKRGFFWSKTKGLNADIARHRIKEKELREKIAELEKEVLTDPGMDTYLQAYRSLLIKLQDSKAEVVSRIGQ